MYDHMSHSMSFCRADTTILSGKQEGRQLEEPEEDDGELLAVMVEERKKCGVLTADHSKDMVQ